MSTSPVRGTVIYDLDHTLISCDSDYEWGQFLADSGAIDGSAYRLQNQKFYQDYLTGTLDPDTYLAFVLAPLAQLDPPRLQQLRMQFLQERVQPSLRPKAQELVVRHRTRGLRQLIATSTNAFIAAPIAQIFGIETLIAPQPEVRDGHYTGRLLGKHSYGPGKPLRIQEWAARENIELGETWAYSDSSTDIPMLSSVTHPVAVDPDRHLREHAMRLGWDIISLAS